MNFIKKEVEEVTKQGGALQQKEWPFEKHQCGCLKANQEEESIQKPQTSR
jgi:hypothetical protein